jgi:hypothetical protein
MQMQAALLKAKLRIMSEEIFPAHHPVDLVEGGQMIPPKVQHWVRRSGHDLIRAKAQAYDVLRHTQVMYNESVSKPSIKPKCPKCGGYITYYRIRDKQQHCRTCGHDFDPPKK